MTWDGYSEGRKAPVTRKAGPGYADPDYDLADDWIAAKAAVDAAQARHEDAAGPGRILLINASSRSEHTALARCRRAGACWRWPRRRSPWRRRS